MLQLTTTGKEIGSRSTKVKLFSELRRPRKRPGSCHLQCSRARQQRRRGASLRPGPGGAHQPHDSGRPQPRPARDRRRGHRERLRRDLRRVVRDQLENSTANLGQVRAAPVDTDQVAGRDPLSGCSPRFGGRGPRTSHVLGEGGARWPADRAGLGAASVRGLGSLLGASHRRATPGRETQKGGLSFGFVEVHEAILTLCCSLTQAEVHTQPTLELVSLIFTLGIETLAESKRNIFLTSHCFKEFYEYNCYASLVNRYLIQ